MLGLRKNTKPVQGKSQGCRLLTPDEMDRNLSLERERCDRYCQYFSLIIVRVPEGSLERFSENLDTFLEDRLRLSDDAGFLRKGGVGILLPMTDLEGAQIVLSGVHQFAKDKQVDVKTEVFTYSGRGGNGPDKAVTKGGQSSGDDSASFEESQVENSDTSLQFSASGVCETSVYSSVTTSFTTVGSYERYSSNSLSPSLLQMEECSFDPSEIFAKTKPRLERRAVKQGVVEGHREEDLLEYCSPAFPAWKRALDVTAALAGLVATAPIMIGAAIAIKLTSKGPVFFKQMRSGQYGRPFPVYKLRTMVVDAEELKAALQVRNERDGPAFKLKDDPRVTSVGHFLRRVGADELPQLLNVLLGHMSIVGPRPLPIAEDVQCASWQRKRLDTKPGLTCTWQIGKSRGISFLEWMRLDRKYGKDRSIVTDIKLVFKTIGAVVMGRVGH